MSSGGSGNYPSERAGPWYLTAEQVEDALEVDLHGGHGDLAPVLEVVAHLGEEVADHAVRHALVRRP